jgi:hypothetical protein
MPNESSRRYLFVTIARPTRWVFLHIYGGMSQRSSVDFLRRLMLASPIKIAKILTDNGSQFTDRFAAKDKKPSGQHAFDTVCTGIGMEHRLTLPPSANERHGGALQRPHQRVSAADPLDSRPIWRQPCSITSSSTTLTFHTALSAQQRQSTRSRNGTSQARTIP